MNMRNNHVRVDPSHPQAQGICDRCGFRGQINGGPYPLRWQYEWQGPNIQNLRLKVCPSCMDKPNEQLRSYNLGPDPLPVQDPRFENVDMD